MKNTNVNDKSATSNVFSNTETDSNFPFAEKAIFTDEFLNKGNCLEFKIKAFTKKAFPAFTNFFIENLGKLQFKSVKFTFLFQNLDQFQKFSSQFNSFIKAFSGKNSGNFEFSILQDTDNSAFKNSKPEETGFNFQFDFPNQDFMFSAQASNR